MPTPKKNSSDANPISAEQKAYIKKLLQTLKQTYPEAPCALYHHTAFQLLTATILSAQCTDERVNQSTPQLFDKYPTAQELALAKQADVEKIVKPLGFFRAKASNIINMAKQLTEQHAGEVPQELEKLITLSGVGRKTANVLLGTWFNIPSGVVVDTHVKRLTQIWGLTDSTNPEQIEQNLMVQLPKKEWIMFSHRTIHHGRKFCKARNPDCPNCPLLKFCPRFGLKPLADL
jgi:endonuclease-3